MWKIANVYAYMKVYFLHCYLCFGLFQCVNNSSIIIHVKYNIQVDWQPPPQKKGVKVSVSGIEKPVCGLHTLIKKQSYIKVIINGELRVSEVNHIIMFQIKSMEYDRLFYLFSITLWLNPLKILYLLYCMLYLGFFSTFSHGVYRRVFGGVSGITNRQQLYL